MILIGTSGYDYDDWRGFFYPEDLPKNQFLSYYASHFNALELNFSFYRMPTAKQLETMLQRTEGKVEFSIKAHRSMTHDRIAGNHDITQFKEALTPLLEANKLGAVLLQFPHSFNQTEENRKYLKQLADQIGPPVVVEFRRVEWSATPIRKWINSIKAGYCCVDEPHLDGLMPRQAVATATPAYVRFHGRNASKWYTHNHAYERYDYLYNIRELQEWAPLIDQLDKQTQKTMVFFNNHFQAKAVDGAKKLADLLRIR